MNAQFCLILYEDNMLTIIGPTKAVRALIAHNCRVRKISTNDFLFYEMNIVSSETAFATSIKEHSNITSAKSGPPPLLM